MSREIYFKKRFSYTGTEVILYPFQTDLISRGWEINNSTQTNFQILAYQELICIYLLKSTSQDREIGSWLLISRCWQNLK